MAEEIKNIVEKYFAGKTSIDELEQLDTWYNSIDFQKDLYFADSPELSHVLSKRFAELKLTLGIC